jgi:hypothetical protein
MADAKLLDQIVKAFHFLKVPDFVFVGFILKVLLDLGGASLPDATYLFHDL